LSTITQLRDVYFCGIQEGSYKHFYAQHRGGLDHYWANQYAQEQARATRFGDWVKSAQGDTAYVFIITPKLMDLWNYCYEKYNLSKYIIGKSRKPAHNFLYKGDGPKLSYFILHFKDKQ
jgi:hypothetical protein